MYLGLIWRWFWVRNQRESPSWPIETKPTRRFEEIQLFVCDSACSRHRSAGINGREAGLIRQLIAGAKKSHVHEQWLVFSSFCSLLTASAWQGRRWLEEGHQVNSPLVGSDIVCYPWLMRPFFLVNCTYLSDFTPISHLNSKLLQNHASR